MRRLLLATVVMAFPVIGTLAVAGTATAASPSASAGVSCSKISGKVNTTTDAATIKLTGCTDPKNTDGKGSAKGSETSTTETITWGNKETTILGNVVDTPISPGTCPGSDIEEESTATVTGGTSKSIKKGWTEQAYVCYNPSNSTISLLPGTTYEIGKGL